MVLPLLEFWYAALLLLQSLLLFLLHFNIYFFVTDSFLFKYIWSKMDGMTISDSQVYIRRWVLDRVFERTEFISYNYFPFGPYYLYVRLRAINIKQTSLTIMNDHIASKTFVGYFSPFFSTKKIGFGWAHMHHNDKMCWYKMYKPEKNCAHLIRCKRFLFCKNMYGLNDGCGGILLFTCIPLSLTRSYSFCTLRCAVLLSGIICTTNYNERS